MSTATGDFGAIPLGDGRTRFRVWAPDAASMAVDIGGRAHTLRPGPDGVHEAVLPAAPGTRYRYVVDGVDRVPDPASRRQPDDVHGDSEVVDPHAYPWRHDRWRGRPWREAVIYETHVGACGGFDGLRAQLPRLAAMGVTAVELMPLGAFAGTRNWGYDGVLPYAPHAAYGTPEQLQALVDTAHGHGLMVLLDVVYNHFGPDGNHLHRYAGRFFRDDRSTPWGPAIDFRQPAVRRYFIDNALMWLRDYRMDGLRLDAVHAIDAPDFLRVLRETIEREVGGARHVHLVLENEHNTASLLGGGRRGAFTAQWNDDFHNALHVLLTGESEAYYADYTDAPAARLARVLGEGFAFQGEPDRRGQPRGEPSGHLPPLAFVAFAQNHDQIGNRALGERLRTLVDAERLRAAMALVALCPMVPLFFMGEPWGARNPFLFFTDFAPPLDERVREGRRREFAQFRAFADPARRAAIPDPNDPATFAASIADIADAAHGEGAAWSAWFASLLALRRERLTPRLDAARALGAHATGPRAVSASWSLADGETLYIEANFGDATVPARAPRDAALLHAEPAGAGDGDDAWIPPRALVARIGSAS